MLRKVSTNTPLRDWDKRVNRQWTPWPKRMTSGRIVWFGYYYRFEELTNVEPRHMWIREVTYTEEEYFLERLSR